MKKIILCFISFVFLTKFAVAFETSAKYAVIMDYQTGDVLFEKNAFEKMKPSSMTKLMTTYILFKYLNNNVFKLDDTLRVSENAWRTGGSKMFVHVDDQVKVEDLLRGIIVQSGNDACTVVAESIGSSEEEFARMMNQTGKEMGLRGSNFENSTGWPSDNHYMTAYDIALISRNIIKDFPQYYPYFAETGFEYNGITQPNRNGLLFRNPSVDGLKTGHTEEAGYGIAISGTNDDRRLIVVVNGLSSETERLNEAERLLNYGFRNFQTITLVKKGQVLDKAKLWFAGEDYVNLVSQENISVSIPKMNEKSVYAEVIYNSPIIAPVTAETAIAELKIYIPNQEVRTYKLYPEQDVKKANFFRELLLTADYYLLGN